MGDLIKSIFKHSYCIVCEIDLSKQLWLCDFCYNNLPWFTLNSYRCMRCMDPLDDKSHILCEDCRNNLAINKVYVIFDYLPPIKNMLLSLKFSQKLIYAKFFGNILLDIIQNKWYPHNGLPELIIPVPLHLYKLRSRGFNQSFEIAKILQKIIPVDPFSCIRERATPTQLNLSKIQRMVNTKYAFKVVKPLSCNYLAIIDDVITTGATIKNLVTAIKQFQPELKIDVWVVAKH